MRKLIVLQNLRFAFVVGPYLTIAVHRVLTADRLRLRYILAGRRLQAAEREQTDGDGQKADHHFPWPRCTEFAVRIEHT